MSYLLSYPKLEAKGALDSTLPAQSAGLVAGRFKIWVAEPCGRRVWGQVDSYFSRWLGRSLLFAVPSPRQARRPGGAKLQLRWC